MGGEKRGQVQFSLVQLRRVKTVAIQIHELKDVKAQSGTIYDELLCVLIKQTGVRTNHLIGKLLTLIEASLGDSVAAKALKSIIKEEVWASTTQFDEDMIAAVHLVAEEEKKDLTLYKDTSRLGRYFFERPQPEA